MRSGIKDFFMTFGSQMLALPLSLLSQSVLAWSLAPAGRGSYALCVVFATVIQVLFVLGVDVAIEYHLASRKTDVSQAVLDTFLWGIFGSGMAILAGLLVIHYQAAIPFVGQALSKATPTQLYMALAIIPPAFISSMLYRVPLSLKDFKLGGILLVAGTTLQLALTALLVLVFRFGVEGALVATILQHIISVGVLLLLYRRLYGLKIARPSMARVKSNFHFGVRYYVGKVSNLATMQISTIILAFFATQEELGFFAVAATFVSAAEVIPNVLTTILIPRVATDQAGRSDLVAQCARVTGVICAVGLGVVAIFAVPIVTLLFSPKFLPICTLIRLIAIGVLIRCACKVFVPYLVCTNRPGIASTAVAAGMIVNLPMLWFLMPRYGLNAAAWAMTANYVVSSIIILLAFSHHSQLSQLRIWRPRKSDWEPLLDGVRKQFGRRQVQS